MRWVMPMKTTELELPFTAPEVAAEVMRWLAYLGAERRMSPKTVEAYQRDVSQFLSFMAEHRGGRISLAALVRLAPQDVRALLAAPPPPRPRPRALLSG